MKKYSLILLSAVLLAGCSRAAGTASVSVEEPETVYEISSENSAYMPIKDNARYVFNGSEGKLDFTLTQGTYGYSIIQNDTGKEKSARYTNSAEERVAEYMKVQDGVLYMLLESRNTNTGEYKTYIFKNAGELSGYATDYLVDLSDEEQIHLVKNELYGITANLALISTTSEVGSMSVYDSLSLKGTAKLWYDYGNQENELWYTTQGIVMLVPDDSSYADQWDTVVVPANTAVTIAAENSYISDDFYGVWQLGDFWYSCSFTLNGQNMTAVLPVNSEENMLCLQDLQASTAFSNCQIYVDGDMNLWDKGMLSLVDNQENITAGTYYAFENTDYMTHEIKDELTEDDIYYLELNEHVKYIRLSYMGYTTLNDGTYGITVGYDDGYEETAFIYCYAGTGTIKQVQISSHDNSGNEKDPEFSNYENSVFPAGTAVCTGDSESGSYMTFTNTVEWGEEPVIRLELTDGYRTFSELGIGSIETDVYHE